MFQNVLTHGTKKQMKMEIVNNYNNTICRIDSVLCSISFYVK